MERLLRLALSGLLILSPVGAYAEDPAMPCPYRDYRHLMGQPSAKAFEADLPESVRHIPGDVVPWRTDTSRLSIMHSGTLEQARTDPASIVVGLICG